MINAEKDHIRPDHRPWFNGYRGGTSNWLLDKPPTCFDWLFAQRLKDPIPAQETALDMGSGNGKKTLLLAEAGIKNVTGIDMVSEAVQMSRLLTTSHNLNGHVKFLEGKILDITKNMPGKSVHIITDTYVFTHQIPDEEGDSVEDYVNEYYRLLVPGGLLALELFSAEDEHFYGQKLEDIEPTNAPDGNLAFKRYKYQHDPSKEEAEGAESYHDMHNVHYSEKGIAWVLGDKFEILRAETLPHSRHAHRKVLDILARVNK